jgi:hypothetical protein
MKNNDALISTMNLEFIQKVDRKYGQALRLFYENVYDEMFRHGATNYCLSHRICIQLPPRSARHTRICTLFRHGKIKPSL